MGKKETVPELIGRILVVALVFGVLAWMGISFWRDTFVKLPPPLEPPVYGVSYPYSFFNVNPLDGMSYVKEVASDMKNIKAAGFGGVKINFHFLQDNAISEAAAAEAAKNGIYPIGQLTGHDQKPRERAFGDSELAAWDKFVRDEARATKDIVYYWEVWNEPSMTELKFRYGTPQEYLGLLERTQKIIKEENPEAKIIVTADYSDTQAEAFTNEFLSLGGAKYFDYLSFHPYNTFDRDSRYNLAETIAQEKELARKFNKPLWITEIGYPDSDSSEAGQAQNASAMFNAASENKIPIVWFYWSERRVSAVDGKTGWGLVRGDNSSKPALESIKTIINGK